MINIGYYLGLLQITSNPKILNFRKTRQNLKRVLRRIPDWEIELLKLVHGWDKSEKLYVFIINI